MQKFPLAIAANPKTRRAASSLSAWPCTAQGLPAATSLPRRCAVYRTFSTLSKTEICEGMFSVALSRLRGSLRQGWPLATVPPCGVRTFLTGTCDIPARPSSSLFTSIIRKPRRTVSAQPVNRFRCDGYFARLRPHGVAPDIEYSNTAWNR